MKLNLIRRSDFSFVPATDEDMEKALKIKKGQAVECSVKVLRNYKFLRKFFAMINTAWEFLTENQKEMFSNSKDVFRQALTANAGYCELIPSSSKGVVIVPKSIAFDKMSEAEFERLYEDVVNKLFEWLMPNVDRYTFYEAMKDF